MRRNVHHQVQPGAVKLVLWRHWMYLSDKPSVTSENQFHCTPAVHVCIDLNHSHGPLSLPPNPHLLEKKSRTALASTIDREHGLRFIFLKITTVTKRVSLQAEQCLDRTACTAKRAHRVKNRKQVSVLTVSFTTRSSDKNWHFSWKSASDWRI